MEKFKEGYLWKKANRLGSKWAKRFFMVSNGVFSCSTSPSTANNPKWSIPLLLLNAHADSQESRLNCFAITTSNRKVTLQAVSRYDMEEWLYVIQNATTQELAGSKSTQENSKSTPQTNKNFNEDMVCVDCGAPGHWIIAHRGGYLCDKCANVHYQKLPNHKLAIYKYILPKAYGNKFICKECGNNLENLNNYKNCDNCNYSLCNECGNNHIKKNPSHYLKIIKRNSSPNEGNQNQDFKIQNLDNKDEGIFPNNNINEDNNKNNSDYYDKVQNKYDIHIPNDKCISCYNDLSLMDNEIVCHCNTCLGNLCESCKDNHLNNNHNLSNINILISKDNEDISENKICIECKIKIEYLNNYPIYKCLNCEGELCDKCGNNHFLNGPNHKIILVRKKYLNECADQIKGTLNFISFANLK